jgi:hypothetical protein
MTDWDECPVFEVIEEIFKNVYGILSIRHACSES